MRDLYVCTDSNDSALFPNFEVSLAWFWRENFQTLNGEEGRGKGRTNRYQLEWGSKERMEMVEKNMYVQNAA